jgi:hypothetical protein
MHGLRLLDDQAVLDQLAHILAAVRVADLGGLIWVQPALPSQQDSHGSVDYTVQQRHWRTASISQP